MDSNSIQERFIKEVDKLKFRFPVAQLSKDLDYGQPTISDYLKGKKQVSEKFFKRFCEFYKLPLEGSPQSQKRTIPVVGEAFDIIQRIGEC